MKYMFPTSNLNCAEEGDVALPQLEGGPGPDVPVQRPLGDERPVLRGFGLQVVLKFEVNCVIKNANLTKGLIAKLLPNRVNHWRFEAR